MKRNWYAVYTRPQREKKVALILTKRGIKNYLAVNNIIVYNAGNKKTNRETLFSCYVFIYISEAEISLVKDIPGMVNFVYWMAKPAIIKREEIEAVRELTLGYHNIRLEKSSVNTSDTIRIIDEPVISFSENSASIKFQTLKIILPSLGFTMIAERDKVNAVILQGELVNGEGADKKLSSFFSN